MQTDRLTDRVALILGTGVTRLSALHGGCIARVLRVDLDDGRRVVVKHDPGPNPRLEIEGMMLGHLGSAGVLPVPTVLHAEPGMLIIEHVDHDGARSPEGEVQAADDLARLHSISAPAFGFETDTLIGSLDQPNAWSPNWPRFFAEQRLLHFGRLADRAASLPRGTMSRLERLAGDIDRYIDPPPTRPALIHGDVWGGNVLWHGGRVSAFIDPAIYFADPEIELAFIDLFSCFGPAFWERTEAVGAIRPGFREVRRDLYNLYPLLVHATLFGGGYGSSVASALDRLGVA